MATADHRIHRAKRHARELRRRLGQELRQARIAAGLSQASLARATEIPKSTIGRIEREEDPTVSVEELAILMALVGHRLVASAPPEGSPHRDAGHHRLLAETRALRPTGAPWRMEVPFPNEGDLRCWDATTVIDGLPVAFEAETRPRDGQDSSDVSTRSVGTVASIG